MMMAASRAMFRVWGLDPRELRPVAATARKARRKRLA